MSHKRIIIKIDFYDEYKTTILGVQEVAKEDTDKYGILDVKHIEDRVYWEQQ